MSDGPLVLCYHAVSDRWPCELAVPAERLQRQLEALLACGYRATTFSAAVAAPPTAKLLAVTFDDGFQSTITGGAPVLQRLGIPATAFVPSAFIGTGTLSWPGIEEWADGPFANELAPVSWATLRALAEAGWEIGSHTCTHAHLPTLSDERLEQELRRSRAVIEEQLERPCRSLAYPFGAVDRRVIAAARSAGYDAAAALPGRLDRPTALAWPRIGIYGTDGPWRFRAKVGRAPRALRETPVAAPMLAAHRLSLRLSEAAAFRRANAVAPRSHCGLRRAHARAVPAALAVLVTDAEERSMVAVTRALARGGYRVGAAASSRHAPAHWSRYCAERLWLADPLRDEAGYVDGLECALRTGRYAAFIPGSDPALLIASRNRGRLEAHARIGLPSHGTVLRSLDKLALTQAAAGTGLVVPETLLCTGVKEARSAARELGFPVALKPRSSVFEFAGALRHLPGRIVHSEAELAHVAPAYGEHCLIQSYETGELLAYGGVVAGGRLLASSLARSWRTHRPDSGSLAFCEAIDVPPRLHAGVAELMRRTGHEGIFELDLLARADGSVALLDLNPRPYGALALAVQGGANLPKIWCDWLLDRDPQPVDAEAGAMFRWEDADLFHLACRLRQHQLRAAASVLVPHRHVAHAYFAVADPGPFAARMLWLLKDFTRNGFSDRRAQGA